MTAQPTLRAEAVRADAVDAGSLDTLLHMADKEMYLQKELKRSDASGDAVP